MRRIFSRFDVTGPLVLGLSLVVGGLLAAVINKDVSLGFLVDIGVGGGAGAAFTFALNRWQASRLRTERDNEIIALIASYRSEADEETRAKRAEGNAVLKQVSEFAYDQMRRSTARETLTTIGTILAEADRHWYSAFPALARCPDFNGAWDLYFVLRRNLSSAAHELRKFHRLLDQLENVAVANPERDFGSMQKEGTQQRSSPDSAVIAFRPLQAAIQRRDESSNEIPSLQTMAYGGTGTDTDLQEKLAKFWHLFNIATIDMRQAYLLLYQINSKESFDIDRDIAECKTTLGACLERVRNCLRIFGLLDASTELTEGNTSISSEDLTLLVDHAKRIERGHITGNEYARLLPANFGVMIRDLDTAFQALGGPIQH